MKVYRIVSEDHVKLGKSAHYNGNFPNPTDLCDMSKH